MVSVIIGVVVIIVGLVCWWVWERDVVETFCISLPLTCVVTAVVVVAGIMSSPTFEDYYTSLEVAGTSTYYLDENSNMVELNEMVRIEASDEVKEPTIRVRHYDQTHFIKADNVTLLVPEKKS